MPCFRTLSNVLFQIRMRMFPHQSQYHPIWATDGLTVLNRIEMTHYCLSMVLCDAECILQSKLTFLNTYPSPSSQRVIIPSACSVWMLVHYVVKHSRPPDFKSSSIVSLPFPWQIKEPEAEPSLILHHE